MNEPAPAPSPEPPQELVAKPAVLRMTIEIKRKETGKVETHHLIGTPVEEPKE